MFCVNLSLSASSWLLSFSRPILCANATSRTMQAHARPLSSSLIRPDSNSCQSAVWQLTRMLFRTTCVVLSNDLQVAVLALAPGWVRAAGPAAATVLLSAAVATAMGRCAAGEAQPCLAIWLPFDQRLMPLGAVLQPLRLLGKHRGRLAEPGWACARGEQHGNATVVQTPHTMPT